MANIKQQAKRIKTNEKKRLCNNSFKSSMKTAIKAVEAACKEGNKEQANLALTVAYKKLDKALQKGLVHKNFVARNKSQLAKLVNNIA